MQTGKVELMAQQVVLAFLGFYNGAIDGIWSDASIRAKRAFECDDAYARGIPSNGLPFTLHDKLPKDLYWDKKLLNHRNLTPEKMQELIKTRTRTPAPVQTPTNPQKQHGQKNQPVVEAKESENSDDDAQE
jgi:hypothetical protein